MSDDTQSKLIEYAARQGAGGRGVGFSTDREKITAIVQEMSEVLVDNDRCGLLEDNDRDEDQDPTILSPLPSRASRKNR